MPGETRNIIKSFMLLKAERDMLLKQCEEYQKAHNELYCAMISFLMQNGREMRLKHEFIAPLRMEDYRIETMPSEGEIVYRLLYVCDPT